MKKFYLDIEVDICKAFAGKAPAHLQLWINLMFKVASEYYPQYIHRCPYHVSI